MNSKISGKIFSYLFAISSILIAVAFFTISDSFARPEVNSVARTFDVYLKEIESKGDNGEVIISHDKLDISVSLKEPKEIYQIHAKLINNGDINAVINNINKTDLSKILVGTSSNGNNFYMSDYVSFTVNYLQNNKSNKVIVDTPIKIGDEINKGTNNDILITVKYKDINRLSEEQREVLEENINNEINLNLNVSLNIGERIL